MASLKREHQNGYSLDVSSLSLATVLKLLDSQLSGHFLWKPHDSPWLA